MKLQYLLTILIPIILIAGCVDQEDGNGVKGQGISIKYLATISTGTTELKSPAGIAVDNSGKIYVPDRQLNKIVIYNPDYSLFGTIGEGPLAGSGDYQFNAPHDVAIDNSGNIYIVDMSNNRIQIYNANKDYIAKIGRFTGAANDQFRSPSEIKIKNNKIYVVDDDNLRVQVFGINREYIATIGGTQNVGSLEGQLRDISGVAIDSMGKIYVVDPQNNRVLIYNPDYSYYKTLGEGVQGEGDYQFYAPNDIFIDSKDRIYISEGGNNRIQIYDPNLNYLLTIGKGLGLESGSGEYEFRTPFGLFIDRQNRLYVSDVFNLRVQIFQISG
jgi:sugar lactone lactonase YvrE